MNLQEVGTYIELALEGGLDLFRELCKQSALFCLVGILRLQNLFVLFPKVHDGAVNGIGCKDPDDF